MRVLFVFSIGRYDGGAAVVWLNLIDALRQRGVEPYVLLPEDKDGTMVAQLEQRQVPYETCFFTWWVTTDAHPRSLKRRLARCGAQLVNARAERVVERLVCEHAIDVVYLCDGTITAGLRAAHRCGVPSVWHFHQYVNGGPAGVQFIDDDARVRETLAQASVLITVNEGISADLRQRFSRTLPTVAVYNGIAPERLAQRTAPPLSGSEVVFTLVGRIDANKGQRDAIEAFGHIARAFPPARLRLVGEGDPTLVGQLKALAAAQSGAERIEWCGHRDDMAAVWATTDVALNCSHSEGCSLVVAEALCSGCVVLTSDAPGNVELLEVGAGLCYERGDARALAEQMCWVLEHVEQAQAIAAEGQCRARQVFNLEAQGDAIYQILCDAKAAAGELAQERERS